MLAINKSRSQRGHLSSRYQGPMDTGGYTPAPNNLPNPASLKLTPAKRDLRLQKVLADIRADSVRNGTGKLTLKEINTEIAGVRSSRRGAR